MSHIPPICKFPRSAANLRKVEAAARESYKALCAKSAAEQAAIFGEVTSSPRNIRSFLGLMPSADATPEEIGAQSGAGQWYQKFERESMKGKS